MMYMRSQRHKGSGRTQWILMFALVRKAQRQILHAMYMPDMSLIDIVIFRHFYSLPTLEGGVKLHIISRLENI